MSLLRQCHHDADQPMHCPLQLSGCAAQCFACALRARALRARTGEQTNGSTEVVHVPITPCSQPEHGAVVMSQSPAGLSPVQLHTNLVKPQTCKRDSGQHVQQARSVTQPLHARMGTHAKLSPPGHVTLSFSHHWTDISSMQPHWHLHL
jgi:hypothetical protein